jgi:HK97 family phage prohead protease
MNKELRFINLKGTDTNTIVGTAIIFNSLSEKINNEFREIISPDAVSQELINSSDIFMLYNHNADNGVLARSNKGKGTLQININTIGVDYSFEPSNRKGEEISNDIKNGNLTACSFAFSVAPNGQKWENRNGEYIRTITKIDKLYDFSVVPMPAYTQTSVSIRSLEEFKEMEQKELEEVKKKEQELSDYYSKYEGIINNLKTE